MKQARIGYFAALAVTVLVPTSALVPVSAMAQSRGHAPSHSEPVMAPMQTHTSGTVRQDSGSGSMMAHNGGSPVVKRHKRCRTTWRHHRRVRVCR